MTTTQHEPLDPQSTAFIELMAKQDQVRSGIVAGVRLVLVVLSARGMVYDVEALRQKILLAYPEAAVFFQTSMGKAIGPKVPRHVDLLIDFTGPGVRQGFFHSKKLRGLARVAVGRNAGFFRKKIYDRVFDEKANLKTLPDEILARERVVQRAVMALAGITVVQAGDTPADQSKTIALHMPGLERL